MNLYLVERTNQAQFDEYDSYVVASESVETAPITNDGRWGAHHGWTGFTVTLIGVADPSVKPGLVIASINAG